MFSTGMENGKTDYFKSLVKYSYTIYTEKLMDYARLFELYSINIDVKDETKCFISQ